MSPLDPISGNSLPDIGPQGICDGLRNPTYMLYIYVAGIGGQNPNDTTCWQASKLKDS